MNGKRLLGGQIGFGALFEHVRKSYPGMPEFDLALDQLRKLGVTEVQRSAQLGARVYAKVAKP